MADYIETQTKDGIVLRIEVEGDMKGAAGFGRQAATGDVSGRAAKDAYNQTLEAIRACANGVIDTIQGLEAQPSAASIDFAIKVDPKAGAMVAKTMGEGQFKVSLSWKQVEPDSEEEKS